MENRSQIDPYIFWPALIVIVGVSTALALAPGPGGQLVNAALAWITYKLDWLYMIGAFIAFLFLVYAAVGPWGNIKLGGPDDKPEFSTLSWIAMLFCAGIGSSLIYWAIAEPLYYMQWPPFGAEPFSADAAGWAVTYGMYHWGFIAWALYCIPALPIAYAVYVRKDPHLRASTACRGILGDMVDGWVGKVIDVCVMFGLVGGVGTSLGLNVPMISAAMSKIFGVPESFGLNVIILIIWTCIFGTSVYLGLYKGIKVLSDINVYVALALLAFVLFAGPTFFILSHFSESLSYLFQNWFRMSLWTDPVAKGGFPQGWTVFYWAWWIAYAVYMGLFVARISKGRTIRELVMAECFWGTLGCWAYFAVFGGYTVHLEINGIIPLTKVLSEKGGPAAIVEAISALPGSVIILPVFVVVAFIFLATTLDSSAYTLASIATKTLRGDEQPARWVRVVWAAALAAVGVAVLAIGGLSAIQTSSVIASLPLIIVIVLMVLSFMRWVKEDFPDLGGKPQSVDYKE
jgi:BCCT family betaine/carnitine transporter